MSAAWISALVATAAERAQGARACAHMRELAFGALHSALADGDPRLIVAAHTRLEVADQDLVRADAALAAARGLLRLELSSRGGNPGRR